MFIEPLAEKTFLAPAGRHVGFLRYRFPLLNSPSLRSIGMFPFCVLCALCSSFTVTNSLNTASRSIFYRLKVQKP